MARTRILGALVASLIAAAGLAVPAASNAATILSFEKLAQSGWSSRQEGKGARRQQAADATQTVTATIGSRRLSLELTSSLQLLERMSPEQRADVLGAEVELWRGSIPGMSGSWVRLLRTPRGLRGAIYDGVTLFRVTPIGEVRTQLAQPSGLPDSQVIAFSMNDVEMAHDAAMCSIQLPAGVSSNASNYLNLNSELRGLLQISKPNATRQMNISVLIDHKAFELFPQVSEMALDAAHVADGIYSDQLALELRVTTFEMLSADDPLLSGSDWLDAAANYRAATPALQSTAVTYLITGRPLGEDILGLAYLDGACGVRTGAAAGQVGHGFMGAVMAHEIAHTLGAVHDGEGACATAPIGYLMAPRMNGSNEFSQCSLDTLQPQAWTRSCILDRTPTYSELEIGSDPPGKLLLDLPWRMHFGVENRGYEDSMDARLLIDVPESWEIEPSLGCERVSSALVECRIPQLPPTGRDTFEMIVTPRQIGLTTLRARIVSDNEGPGPYDSVAYDLEVVGGISVSSSLQPQAGVYSRIDQQSATMQAGDPITFQALAVNGLGQLPAHARMTITMPADWPVSGLQATKGTCDLVRDAHDAVIECDVGVLTPSDFSSDNASISFTTTPQAGQHQITAVVTDEEGGENIGPGTSTFTLTVQSPTPPPSPPPSNGGSAQQSGGGGGSFNAWVALLLLMLQPVSRFQPRRRALKVSRQGACQ